MYINLLKKNCQHIKLKIITGQHIGCERLQYIVRKLPHQEIFQRSNWNE